MLQAFFSDSWGLAIAILFFGGSIFIHELGHLLAARWRGLHASRFSIGFGPKIASWHFWGVEWTLAWLPLGGYVALPQLADLRQIEGDSDVDVSTLPEVSYLSKVIVFAAGAAFNVGLALVVATILWWAGVPTNKSIESTQVGEVLAEITLPDHTKVPGPAAEAHLMPGDYIREIDGKGVSNWSDLKQTLASSTGRTGDGRPRARLTVERDGKIFDVGVYPRLAGDENTRTLGVITAEEFVVTKVSGLGSEAGFQPGDRITAVEGTPLFGSKLLIDALGKDPAKPVALTVQRDGKPFTLTVGDRSKLKEPANFGLIFDSGYELLHTPPFTLMGDTARMAARTLYGLVHPQSDLGPAQLTSPLGIARGFYLTARADIRLALWLLVLVNVNLAIINLLPIPILDGGHIIIATIDRLRGRRMPTQLLAALNGTFMVLILSLMAYVIYRDGVRIRRDNDSARSVETQTTENDASSQSPTTAQPQP